MGYQGQGKTLSYWHTADNRYEVDAVIGDAEIGIEIKSSTNISSQDTKGLKAFGEEHPDAKLLLVSMEERPRLMNDIEIWPAALFLKKLWDGDVCKYSGTSNG